MSSINYQVTQPRVISEAKRGDYAMQFILRHRRAWQAMKADERAAVLRAGAEELEKFVAQMREEADLLGEASRRTQ